MEVQHFAEDSAEVSKVTVNWYCPDAPEVEEQDFNFYTLSQELILSEKMS